MLQVLLLDWATLPDAGARRVGEAAHFTPMSRKRSAEELVRDGKRPRFLPLPELAGLPYPDNKDYH